MSEAASFYYEQGLRQALADGLPTRYALAEGDPLGRGGFGIVYEAHDRLLGDQAAIKVFNRPDLAEMRTGFLEEAKRLHTMQHPNIIGVRWTGMIDNKYRGSDGRLAFDRNVPYLIMDKADGSVAEELRADRVTTHAAAGYLEQAMQGVAYAHQDHSPSSSERTVHRDLKPANFLLQNGQVKVADFGAADTSQSRILDGDSKPGPLVGTPPFMAPEQFRGNVQRSVDIYAMGAVGYYMLDGNMPVYTPHDDVLSWYNAHCEQPVPPMSTRGKPLNDARLIDALQKPFATALAKNPTDRFATMSAFRAALLEAVDEADKLNRRDPRHIPLTDAPAPPHRRTPPGTKLAPPYHPGRDASDALAPPAPKPPTRPYTGVARPEGTLPQEAPKAGAVERPRRPGRDLTADEPDRRLAVPHNSNIARRTLLAALAAGVVGAGVWGVPKLLELGEAPPPIDTASPAQASVDKIAKDILELLTENNKALAGPVLRELIQFNPTWSMEQAEEIGLSYDGTEEFNRRLFVDNPQGALQTFTRLRQEKSDWTAAQLMAAISSGYTPMNQPGTTKAEADRINAHQKLGDPEDNAELFLMLRSLQEEGADYDNWRYLLCAALYPHEPFDINRMNRAAAERHTGNVTTADQVAVKLYEEGDMSGYETLGAVLAAERPDLSAAILERLVTYAIGARDDQQPLDFVASLSDAMAPYAPHVVAEQIDVLMDSRDTWNTPPIATTNRMTVSIAPFKPDAVTKYIDNYAAYPDVHLTAVALGRLLPQYVEDRKTATPSENRIWMEVTLDPGNRDLADNAVSQLEDNSAMLSKSGATIGSGLVAGRRFSNRKS